MEATTGTNTPLPAGKGAADATLSKAAAGVHGAVDKMAGAADEAVRKVRPAIDRAAQIAHQAVDTVAGVAVPTSEWLSEQGESLKAARRNALADAAQYVSAHPWRSLGFAFVGGFIISRLIR